MTIGYVGVGNMGGAVARRMLRSRPPTVFGLSAAALARMAEARANVAGSAAELAASCDVIFLCLPTPDHARGALFGRGRQADVNTIALMMEKLAKVDLVPKGRARVSAAKDRSSRLIAKERSLAPREFTLAKGRTRFRTCRPTCTTAFP